MNKLNNTNHIFGGAKIALFFKDKLLVYLRDKKPDIPFPNMWDLPGGGAENSETPAETIIREVEEEFGLVLREKDLITIHRIKDTRLPRPHLYLYLMFGRLDSGKVSEITFGSEGQYYKLVSEDEFAMLKNFIPVLKPWVEQCFQEINSSHLVK